MEELGLIELTAKELDGAQFKNLVDLLKTYNHMEMSEESIRELLEPCKIYVPEKKEGEIIPRVENFAQAEERWRKAIPGTYEEFHLAVKVKRFSHNSVKEQVAQMTRIAESSGEASKNSLIIFAHTLADLIKSGHAGHHHH